MRPAGSASLEVDTQIAARRPWVPAARELRRWAAAAYGAAAPRARRRASVAEPGSVCVRVVGSAAGRRLNRDYRGKDRPTNVLSFPASDDERRFAGLLGDVVICAPVVAREARSQRKLPEAHWAHMVVHGVLHLLGHDHGSPREARSMERLEVEILRGFGYQNPYLPVTSRDQ
jgi:probable rRNA maturation factor